jgi:hypothetical protein
MKTKLNPSNVELQSYAPRIVAMGLLAAVLLLALTGCKRNATPASAKLDPAGVYALVSVDGKTVPCDISHEGAAMKVKSGTFTITADGACSSAITFNVANHGDMNRVVKAAWTRQGAELTMQWEGAGTTLGSINGNTFAMTNEGMVFAYRK